MFASKHRGRRCGTGRLAHASRSPDAWQARGHHAGQRRSHAVSRIGRLRNALEPQQALELLMEQMRKTRSNAEFLLQVQKTTVSNDRD